MARSKKSTSDYLEKLKDPRWQKRRLEIQERAGWRCQWCGKTDKTLHTHHGHYAKGKEPWEAMDYELYSLCVDCHEEAEYWRKATIASIGFVPPWLLYILCWAAHALGRAARQTANLFNLPCWVAGEEAEPPETDWMLMVKACGGRWFVCSNEHEEANEVQEHCGRVEGDILNSGIAWSDEAAHAIRMDQHQADSQQAP